MSLIKRLEDMRQAVEHIRLKRRAARRTRTAGSDDAPIRPIEPLEQTQPEVPKIGTTDAPGG